MKALTDAIAKVKDTDEDDVRQKVEDRLRRIDEMIAMRTKHEAYMQVTQTHINNIAHAIASSSTKEKELNANMVRLRNEISTKERELKNIQKQRDNKLILFGEDMPKFVAEIERNYSKVVNVYFDPNPVHLSRIYYTMSS